MIKIKDLLSILFPPRCPFCNEIVTLDKMVCDTCEKTIFPEKLEKLLAISKGKMFLCVAPFVYEGPIRSAIHAFKFNGIKSYAIPFGKYVAGTLMDEYNIADFDFITCVPLYKTRKRWRGFNQSELVAREISRISGIPYIEALKKVKNNKSQSKLSRKERISNVKGVYEISEQVQIKGKKIILCDDILTTGNTISECARVLFKAGAKTVIGSTIAMVDYGRK